MTALVELPDKLSARIRVAITDVKKCEADPAYELDMSEWHRPFGFGAMCRVCLAGSVMAQTLGVPIDRECTPSTFEDETKRDYGQLARYLLELDAVRGGMLDNSELTQELADKFNELVEETYDEIAGHSPWHVYLQGADMLEAAGY